MRASRWAVVGLLAFVGCRAEMVLSDPPDPARGAGGAGGARSTLGTGGRMGGGGAMVDAGAGAGTGGADDASLDAPGDAAVTLPPDATGGAADAATAGTPDTMSPVGEDVAAGAGGDAAGAGDSAPPGRVLLLVGSAQLIATDVAVRARLAARMQVQVVPEAAAMTRDADGAALVVLTSSTTTASGLAAKFRDVPVPLMLLEPNLMGLMAMTADATTAHGATLRTETQIAIVAPTHALAAGLSGNVAVYNTPWRLVWGVPAATAMKIATVIGTADHQVIFAYPAGAKMVGATAPAKRLGFFLHDNTADNLTATANQLIDAAIAWLTEP